MKKVSGRIKITAEPNEQRHVRLYVLALLALAREMVAEEEGAEPGKETTRG